MGRIFNDPAFSIVHYVANDVLLPWRRTDDPEIYAVDIFACATLPDVDW